MNSRSSAVSVGGGRHKKDMLLEGIELVFQQAGTLTCHCDWAAEVIFWFFFGGVIAPA